MEVYGTCEWCGGQTHAAYKSQLKRFCSHKCSNNYKWKHIRPKAEYVDIPCSNCGKLITIRKCDHRLKEGQKVFLCSKTCENEYREKNRKECTCIVCGTNFWNGRSKYKLCSSDCKNTYLRYKAYIRLYDSNIELKDFILLYSKKNPFVWAGDKNKYYRRYGRVNRERINWQVYLHRHSDNVIKYRTYLRASIQACYKKNRMFPISIRDIVGCSFVEFRKHIASLFRDGMTEDNYGQWELDHIVPLASAKNIEEINKLCHYSNYQPLWVEENRKKSYKLVEI